jgi:hypothetical protein
MHACRQFVLVILLASTRTRLKMLHCKIAPMIPQNIRVLGVHIERQRPRTPGRSLLSFSGLAIAARCQKRQQVENFLTAKRI